jgi:BTB/POZ domain
MSTSPPKPGPNTPTLDEPLPNLLFLFEYRDADIVLRSRDSHHFRIPKSYIVNSSPVLEEVIRKALDTPDDAHGETSLPVVPLPESGATLHSLLTFVFPVTFWIPLSIERAMELLSVAQKYQMASVLDHIRGRIARQNPPSTDRDSALHTYSLAQKYGLHQEALQAAQAMLKYPMNIGDLEDKLDMMPGASLYELWKYYEKVRSILASNLLEFRTSGARGTLTGLNWRKSTTRSTQRYGPVFATVWRTTKYKSSS